MIRPSQRHLLFIAAAIVAGAVFLVTGLPYSRLGFAQAQDIYRFTQQGECGTVTETGWNGFPVIDVAGCEPDTSIVQSPAWTPIVPGAAVCEDWLVYHTNKTGDWEIFRLGDLPDGVEANPNLSRGVGQRVYDIAPTRSPDQQWVAFMSNRDGNWEIYVSAVEESLQYRVTYNTAAIERNPVWSWDGNKIVYESSRNGNWDLYVFDITSGVETRLTSSAGNDINPYWSPDSSKLAYQNDVAGFWQIYELDLSTLEATLLSDGAGDDHDPQYSNDGQKIAFRSYRDGENSVIYTMNADGTAVTGISDVEGNALNNVWSVDDSLIAYQSDLDGDYDIYIYNARQPETRLLTDNTIDDYAPTWICRSTTVAFTSDITTDANLFSTDALPISAPPVLVENVDQLTFDLEADQYPENTPPEESASQEGSFPSPVKNK